MKNAPAILQPGPRPRAQAGAKTVAFDAPDTRTVDTDRLALHERALARASKDKISYEQAALLEESGAE